MSLVDSPALHLGFASLHVVLGHVGQGLLYRARFGRSPMALYRKGASAHATLSRVVGIASLAWAAALIATATSDTFRSSAPGRPLFDPPSPLGWSVAVAGLTLMLVAQYAMGEHLRIGQHSEDAPPTLRTTGLLAWSRNPIYVGSWGCLAGMSLWHPSAALLATCAVVGAGIHGLVRAEEAFLERRFGDAYRAYRARVPRYVGWPRFHGEGALPPSRSPAASAGQLRFAPSAAMIDPADAIEPSRGVSGLPITRDELRVLERPRTALVLVKTTALFAAWIALGAAAHLTDAVALRVGCWLVLAWVLNGLVQIGHDAWHHNLLPRPWQNALFGHVLGLPFGVSFVAARHAHLRHHWYNRTERDPDAYNVGAGIGVWIQFYVVLFAGLALAPLHFNFLYPAAFFRRREDWTPHVATVVAYAAAYVAVGLCVARFDLWGWMRDGWLVPLLLASPINGLKSVADHYGNVWKGDRFHTATTVRTNRWLGALFHGLNHHLDHHLFPRVPGPNLAALHARLAPVLAEKEAPVFEGYGRVWWRCLRDGPTYVTDGHRFLKRQP